MDAKNNNNMKQGFRAKFIREHLAICNKHISEMNIWESGFIEGLTDGIDFYGIEKVSQNQYNRLKEIANKYDCL